MRLLGSIFLIAAVLLIALSSPDVKNKIQWELADNGARLNMILERRLQKQNLEGKLPNTWNNINQIQILTESTLARNLLKEGLPAIQIQNSTNQKKPVKLEVQIIEVQDDKNPSLIFQLSLIEGSNKTFEIGEQITLVELQ